MIDTSRQSNNSHTKPKWRDVFVAFATIGFMLGFIIGVVFGGSLR